MINKYVRWYDSIIQKADSLHRKKYAGQYYELHHIIPKSLGGSNDKDNLVLLTAKEHFICHHLLTKFMINENKSKMQFAFWNLLNGWGKHRTPFKITSRLYQTIKEDISKLISKINTGRKNPPVTQETRNKISAATKGMKNYWYGKPAHNRGKKRPGIGGRKKGTTWSVTERATQLQVRAQPGYYDFTKNPIRNKKISEAKKGRPGSAKNKHWYNNKLSETYDYICPNNFTIGRLPKLQINKRGLRWFNNKIINRQFREGCQLEGFKHGRICKK